MGSKFMRRDIANFALSLAFRNWGVVPSLIMAIGVGGSIVGHVGPNKWPLSFTLLLVIVFVLFVLTVKSISFAFENYINLTRRLTAVKMLMGEGFNKGTSIIVFEYSEGFSVGQLVTLCCSSSGATHPLMLLEISAVNRDEIQAVCIDASHEKGIRKYFEEEARRKMLFAISSVFLKHLRNTD